MVEMDFKNLLKKNGLNVGQYLIIRYKSNIGRRSNSLRISLLSKYIYLKC